MKFAPVPMGKALVNHYHRHTLSPPLKLSLPSVSTAWESLAFAFRLISPTHPPATSNTSGSLFSIFSGIGIAAHIQLI